MTEKNKKINKHDLYFETTLYEQIDYSNFEDSSILLSGDVDAYSAKNSMETTYTVSFDWIAKIDSKYINSYTTYYKGYGIVTLNCKRKNNDILRFFVCKDEISKWIMKVGQFPSLADIQFAEIGRKYDKILPQEDLKNLKKAIGLVSHGAGAGSFVYLRRIFENLIFETYSANTKTLNITEVDFKLKRMMEKVEVLKEFLPSQLVDMKAIYSILSKGVHELTEDECLKYFAPIKLSIELILDEKIEKAEKLRKDNVVKEQLKTIQQEIAGKE